MCNFKARMLTWKTCISESAVVRALNVLRDIRQKIFPRRMRKTEETARKKSVPQKKEDLRKRVMRWVALTALVFLLRRVTY